VAVPPLTDDDVSVGRHRTLPVANLLAALHGMDVQNGRDGASGHGSTQPQLRTDPQSRPGVQRGAEPVVVASGEVAEPRGCRFVQPGRISRASRPLRRSLRWRPASEGGRSSRRRRRRSSPSTRRTSVSSPTASPWRCHRREQLEQYGRVAAARGQVLEIGDAGDRVDDPLVAQKLLGERLTWTPRLPARRCDLRRRRVPRPPPRECRRQECRRRALRLGRQPCEPEPVPVALRDRYEPWRGCQHTSLVGAASPAAGTRRATLISGLQVCLSGWTWRPPSGGQPAPWARCG